MPIGGRDAIAVQSFAKIIDFDDENDEEDDEYGAEDEEDAHEKLVPQRRRSENLLLRLRRLLLLLLQLLYLMYLLYLLLLLLKHQAVVSMMRFRPARSRHRDFGRFRIGSERVSLDVTGSERLQ